PGSPGSRAGSRSRSGSGRGGCTHPPWLCSWGVEGGGRPTGLGKGMPPASTTRRTGSARRASRRSQPAGRGPAPGAAARAVGAAPGGVGGGRAGLGQGPVGGQPAAGLEPGGAAGPLLLGPAAVLAQERAGELAGPGGQGVG